MLGPDRGLAASLIEPEISARSLKKPGDIVVADAVYVERVSATEFPANREINRENRKNGPRVMTRPLFNAASMPVFIDISCEN
jgi:hypothetical protein